MEEEESNEWIRIMVKEKTLTFLYPGREREVEEEGDSGQGYI